MKMAESLDLYQLSVDFTSNMHSMRWSLTLFHVVDGGEMLDAAAHHAALPPQLGALVRGWWGARG